MAMQFTFVAWKLAGSLSCVHVYNPWLARIIHLGPRCFATELHLSPPPPHTPGGDARDDDDDDDDDNDDDDDDVDDDNDGGGGDDDDDDNGDDVVIADDNKKYSYSTDEPEKQSFNIIQTFHSALYGSD